MLFQTNHSQLNDIFKITDIGYFLSGVSLKFVYSPLLVIN